MIIKGMKPVYRKEQEDGKDGGGTDTGTELDENKPSPDAAALEIEAEARKMGWTEKSEFRGDPDKWRGAEEFVERGRTMLPIVRKTVERQERQIAELQQTIREFAELNSKADARAFERALKELKAEQVAAVKAGDAEAFIEVDEKIASLHKEARDKPVIKLPEPGDDPEFIDWASKNKWYETDKEAAAYSESYAEYLRKKGDTRTGTAFLDEVTKAVKKEFPHKFSNPRRNEPGSVEGGVSSARKGGKTFADMPADARAACDRMMRNGFDGKSKEADEFKANFVKTFFEEA